jgi:very-short-patch-repair endonuclease
MSKEIPFEKSFASHEKAKYWSDKNVLKANEVMKSSHKKYIFNCDCGHEIEISIGNVNSGYWCSYCCNPPKKLCDNKDCKLCFEKSFASHEKAEYWSDKNDLKPNKVFLNSHNKFWFNCNCGHEFEKIISNINKGVWCPYCCNPPQKLCDNEDCAKCYEKSFASHEKAVYWNIEKNNTVPRKIFKNTHVKYYFNCTICNHIFDIALYNILSGGWCSYCFGHHKLCDNNLCIYCYEKSFASHEKSSFWSAKNSLTPRQVHLQSNKKFIFNCSCGHEIEKILGNIITGYWCPYCCLPLNKLCNNSECVMCFNNSFASIEKAKYWSDINNINPREILKGSGKKYWFVCEKQHKFNKQINSISKGGWCPYCVNKTEQKLYDNLQPIYNNLQQQYKVDWCKSDTTNKCYPFDFVLGEHKIIIELDGLQHFEQVSNWDSPDKVNARDKYKMKQANDNGYSVIRILQEDVFYDTYQWLDELKQIIEKIVSENKVQNIFMCKDNEYSIFDTLE